MKYEIDGHKIFDDPREAAEYITDNLDDEVYDNMLDECYPEVEILGLSYAPSIALYRVDEIAYNCGRNDYYDSLSSDIAYDIERMDAEEEEDFYGFTVVAIDDEEETEEEETEEE